MSIITKIDSIPVFTTKTQALSWGRLNGYVGYREQVHFGKRGYIAGKTSGSIAFQKYPAQRATASLAFKNQPTHQMPDGTMMLGATHGEAIYAGEEMLSGGPSGGGGYGGARVGTPTVVQSGSEGSGDSGGYGGRGE